MKRGICVEQGHDFFETPCLIIKKKRGKLSLDEIQDILRYENHQQWNGLYVIFLNCTESTVDGNGCLELLEEQPGDTVMLYELTDSAECPVCTALLPPFRYCPSCGNAWSGQDKTIETLLSSMRQEAERGIKNPNSTEASRQAWYWSHIGAIDLARQMGVISEERRRELYDEMQPLKPHNTDITENGGEDR